jgi:alcohol dehydrogenase
MRQLTFMQPGVLEWHEVPEPRLEGARQAIVAPVAATTCDLDRSIIKGRTPYGGPIALGHEFVTGGTAFCRAVPPTSMYGLGAVTGDWGGAFSDRVRVPFADDMLVRLPKGVAPESVAAASDNLTNAFEAVVPHLERLPGASVVIAGVGATGFYAILVAKAMGAGRVDYLDHDRTRLERAAQLGAHPIEVGKGKPMSSLEHQYEIGVDARGEPAELALVLRSLAPRGVCTSMSMYFRETPLPLFEMMLRGVRFEPTPTNIRAHLREVLSFVQTGRIAPERVTTEILPWEKLPEALAEPSMKPVFVREARHA